MHKINKLKALSAGALVTAFTVLHTSLSYAYDSNVAVVTTPEPGTLLLLGCALAGLYGLRKKIK